MPEADRLYIKARLLLCLCVEFAVRMCSIKKSIPVLKQLGGSFHAVVLRMPCGDAYVAIFSSVYVVVENAYMHCYCVTNACWNDINSRVSLRKYSVVRTFSKIGCSGLMHQ